MNYEEFIEVVEHLNDTNASFGNEILYKMAMDSDLTNKDQLAGAMWLIGRSYAASPQRRSYGVYKEKWPVRPDNDGRGQFFSFIADNIQIQTADIPQDSYAYDNCEQDLDLLKRSILFVLQFNLALSQAIEKFDYATGKAICTNHISFCSKLLHFYSPEAVFIIDNFAQAGSNRLFSNRGLYYMCTPDKPETYRPLYMDDLITNSTIDHNEANDIFLKDDVFAAFSVNDSLCRLEKELKNEVDQCYADRKPENAMLYVTHCIRYYILGCMLKGKITLKELWKNGKTSMPRLTDSVFLNIKGKLLADERKHYQKLNQVYEANEIDDRF
jgi:hypothetical protein